MKTIKNTKSFSLVYVILSFWVLMVKTIITRTNLEVAPDTD